MVWSGIAHYAHLFIRPSMKEVQHGRIQKHGYSSSAGRAGSWQPWPPHHTSPPCRNAKEMRWCLGYCIKKAGSPREPALSFIAKRAAASLPTGGLHSRHINDARRCFADYFPTLAWSRSGAKGPESHAIPSQSGQFGLPQ